ncbi:hypothetical protein FAVG1_13202 [Fusarium avenaceum]|nr:hypothetical protein FAVG1_13202 [Fusarium avenaceum]
MESPTVPENPALRSASDSPEKGIPRKATVESAPEESEEQPYQETRQGIVRVDQIWDKKKRRFLFVKTRKPKDREKKFAKYVVTVARRISTHGTFEGHYVVKIRGSYIQEALSKVYSGVEEISFADPISLDSSNLKLLYFALPSLIKDFEEEKSKDLPNQKMMFELEATRMFIEKHFQATSITLLELPVGQIDFETIWVLFPYHSLAYSPDSLGQPRVYRVREAEYEKNRDGTPFFSVQADYIDSDGQVFGYVGKILLPPINAFAGSVPIRDLPVFPLDMRHTTSQTICSQVLQLANKTIKLKGRHLQEYKGHAITEGSDGNKKFNSHGRVMIDPVVFDQTMPNNGIVPRIRKPLSEARLTDEQKLLINPLAYGFSLGDKIWGAFAVSRVEEVIWNESLAETLVLNQDRKSFIRSLVKHYSAPERTGCLDDFVRDKGKGLIGLLAGPPGVGKTLTAETVAEIAHRPLYTMSSGELGESSTTVQKHLMRVFELAERWKAVVLLDEADVFLTQRSNASLSRNAITSIFLRHLEYYQGILLLTTNRLLSLDEAFKSRIHFAFEFDELSDEARQAIWRSFLARAHVDLGKEGLSRLSKIKLNGRQIKNIANISHAAAQENNTTITVESIMLTMRFTNVMWEATAADR